MPEPTPHQSIVPLMRLSGAEALAVRIADLKEDARRQGYETLAYFLDMAEQEAKIQAERRAKSPTEL